MRPLGVGFLTSGLTGSWKGALRMLLRIRRVSRSHFYRQSKTVSILNPRGTRNKRDRCVKSHKFNLTGFVRNNKSLRCVMHSFIYSSNQHRLTDLFLIVALCGATYSLVKSRQPLAQWVLSRCSLVLAVVLDLWLQDVPAEAADPVASAADAQTEMSTRQTWRDGVQRAPVVVREAYEGKLSRGGT